MIFSIFNDMNKFCSSKSNGIHPNPYDPFPLSLEKRNFQS